MSFRILSVNPYIQYVKCIVEKTKVEPVGPSLKTEYPSKLYRIKVSNECFHCPVSMIRRRV